MSLCWTSDAGDTIKKYFLFLTAHDNDSMVGNRATAPQQQETCGRLLHADASGGTQIRSGDSEHVPVQICRGSARIFTRHAQLFLQLLAWSGLAPILIAPCPNSFNYKYGLWKLRRLYFFISYHAHLSHMFPPLAPREFSPSSSANFMYGQAHPSGVARRRSGSKQNHNSTPSQSPSPRRVMEPSSQRRGCASVPLSKIKRLCSIHSAVPAQADLQVVHVFLYALAFDDVLASWRDVAWL